MKKVVCEFEVGIDLVAPTHVWRIVNQANIGRETVPLDQEWPDFMKQVHRNLAMTHRKKITVQVMSDGNLALKPRQAAIPKKTTRRPKKKITRPSVPRRAT